MCRHFIDHLFCLSGSHGRASLVMKAAANLCSKVAVMVYDLTNSESEFIGTYDMAQN